MIIKFIQKYISITQFDPIEINDFSILTGMNGSGKTHFLKAIKNGSIEIEGIDKSEIVYYNYNDFTVFSGNIQQNPELQQRHNVWNNEKKQYSNKLQSFKNKVINLSTQKLAPIEKVIFDSAFQPNFNFERNFSNISDFDEIQFLKDSQDILLEVTTNQNKFTPLFFQFITKYLKASNGNIDKLTYENLKLEFDNQKKLIEQFLKEEDEGLYKFLKNCIKNKNIFDINDNDFESPDIFLEDIANEEKEYLFIKEANIMNRVKAQEYNENIGYLDSNRFIEKYGNSPVEQINSVLSEYDCNGYFLETNPHQNFLGIDKNSIKIEIFLKNKEKGYDTRFENLSSGEKTLIALSLLIYKTRKNRIIPRVLLLDEVDSSLHPSMINRLLNVLENLFNKKLGFKVIIATHSPTTVALSPDESIYIINNNSINQNIKKEIKSNAIKILTEGIATLNNDDTILGINYNISKTELPVLFTEGITDKIILETAWSKLYGKKMPFIIQDCFDASFLGNLFKRAENERDGIFINYPNRIFIALFDFDQKGYNEWNNLKSKYDIIDETPQNALTKKHSIRNAYALLLPVPENDVIIKQVIKSGTETYKNESILPIELLFYGIKSLNHYFKNVKTTGGGEIFEFIGDKRDFANSLNSLDKSDFHNFIVLFEKLEKIINVS